MLSVGEVVEAFEDSPRSLTVKLRKITKSKCLLLRKVGKGGREEAHTYAPVSTVRWNLGQSLSLPNLLKNVLDLLTKPSDLGSDIGGGPSGSKK
jgi:hypothetical protein